MPPDRRQVALSLALFTAIVVAGGWPWPGATLAFSRACCRLVNATLLEHVTFGSRGHARLQPVAALAPRPGEAVTADATMHLTMDGYRGALELGMSTRREAWLPLLIVSAIALAAPGRVRVRLRRLALGGALVFACSVAGMYLGLLSVFGLQLRGAYQLSELSRGAIDLANRALLLPPANRFILPLAVGLALARPWLRPTEAVARHSPSRYKPVAPSS